MADSIWLKQQLEKKGKSEQYDIPGEDTVTLAERLGLDLKDIIKLDANENFMLSKEFITSELNQLSKLLDTRLYPLNQKTKLTNALSEYLEINPNQIVIGNSSDDVLEIIARAFLKRRTNAISISPTFEMYKIITYFYSKKYIEIPLKKDFSLNTQTLLDACNASTHVCFLCSPNNPTGNQFPLEQVKRLAENFNGLLVVDEAYVEYSPYSLIKQIDNFNNLIILRTFSKAYGLAGLRIGYAVTNQKIASVLKSIQLPYNVNIVSLEMALRMLKRFNQVKDSIDKIKFERNRLIESMKKISGIFPYPSDSNFILFRTLRSSRQVRDELAERAIIIRYYNSAKLQNYLRVTVGTKEMNDKFLEVLKEIANA